MAEAPHILVVGDLMLDRYLWGRCERISPEAPVQVVDVQSTTEQLGGAGNVLNNLVSLGARPRVAGIIGTGESSATTLRLLTDKGIDPRHLHVDASRRITEKTRILAAHSQIVRYDVETRTPLDRVLEDRVIASAIDQLEDVTIAILSDYGKGVITPRVCQELIRYCSQRNIRVLCDPKGRDYSKYRGATMITPNKREAMEATGISIEDAESLSRAGHQLRDQFAFEHALITRGEEGMTLFSADGVQDFRAQAREVFDVTGAGDTVIAALAVALGRGDAPAAACSFATVAAGIAVGKIGAATVTLEEIARYGNEPGAGAANKIRNLDAVISAIAPGRASGRKIVFTNGVFDILHAGHVRYLEDASRLGDILIVGVNTDASVRRLKGPERPINSEHDRAFVLAALRGVDYVILFDEDTPLQLITTLMPDVLVKGGDYTIDRIVGAVVVQAAGGLVTTIPIVPGKSTTHTISRIKEGS